MIMSLGRTWTTTVVSSVLFSLLIFGGNNHANPFVLVRPSCQIRLSSTTASHSSTRKTTSRLFLSDIPRMEDGKKKKKKSKLFDWKSYLPPPPEDQLILTGDLSVLLLYAFSSHFVNNFVVESVLSTSDSIQDALTTLDPMGDLVATAQHTPVWVDQSSPELINSIMTMNVQQTLYNHWGPLYSSAGSAYVAICFSWLLAGWFHQAFLLKNSLDCDTSKTLWKTMETWITMAMIMCLLSLTSNTIVDHFPILKEWLGCSTCWMQHYGDDFTSCLTKDDTIFIIDSATILISWRFMANTVVNWFR